MSEIRRAMKAPEKMIAKVGIEDVPLGNDKLRPLLKTMHDVAVRHRNDVVVFGAKEKIDANRLADRLHPGLIVPSGELMAYHRELIEAMNDDVVAAVRENGKRVVLQPFGPAIGMYHDELWIPTEALLPERKN